MSPIVQVFGRRHDEAIHALRRPASEKRQCTKSREYGTRQCSECYGDRMVVAISMVDAARPEVLIALTRWVRLRLRAALWRQWKTPRRRRAALIANGVSEWVARKTAGSGRGP